MVPKSSHSMDPYTDWLELPSDQHPPNHFQLLGLPVDTENVAQIRQAAEQQLKRVRQRLQEQSLRPDDPTVVHLTTQIKRAYQILADPALRAAYRAGLSGNTPAVDASAPTELGRPAYRPRRRNDVRVYLAVMLAFLLLTGLGLWMFWPEVAVRPGRLTSDSSGSAPGPSRLEFASAGSPSVESALGDLRPAAPLEPGMPGDASSDEASERRPMSHEGSIPPSTQPAKPIMARLPSAATTYQGHTLAVRGVALSVQQRLVISVGGDQQLLVWRFDTPEKPVLIHELGMPGLAVCCLSQTGQVLYATEEKVVQYDVREAKSVHTYLAPGGLITTIELTPDRSGFWMACSDGSVSLWQLGIEKPQTTLAIRDGTLANHRIDCLAVATSGRAVVAGCQDGMLSIWRAVAKPESDQPVWQAVLTKSVQPKGLVALAISEDGKLLAAADATGQTHVWDLSQDPTMRRPIRVFGNLPEIPLCLGFLPDKALVVGGVRMPVRIIDVQAGEVKAKLPGAEGVNDFAIAPANSGILLGERDGTVRWEPLPFNQVEEEVN